ncbi:NADPH-dependent FMN reductase-like domain-containing protein [Candidatus Electrothrix laxa]
MNITILNGNPDAANIKFDDYLCRLASLLRFSEHEVAVFNLRDMDIKQCIGCFSCWVKTPGKCILNDDSPTIYRAYLKSDLVLFSSPVIMGYISALLKKMTEKLLPLIHPYVEFKQKEVHHQARYDKSPLLALLLETGEGVDMEDIDIISDIYKRTAINALTILSFVRLTSEPIEALVNEINRI